MTIKHSIAPAIIFAACLALFAAGCAKQERAQNELPPPEQASDAQIQPPQTPPADEAATETQKPPEAAQTQPTATAKPAAPAPKTPAPQTAQQKIANEMAPQTIYVAIQSGAFSPQVVSVKAGGTVVWTNKDTVPHTTRSDGALLWDSGSLQPNASFKHVFKATGSYKYSCGAHPEMKGTVYVY